MTSQHSDWYHGPQWEGMNLRQPHPVAKSDSGYDGFLGERLYQIKGFNGIKMTSE